MGPRSLVKFSVVLCVASDIRGWEKVEGACIESPPAANGPEPASTAVPIWQLWFC